MIPNTRKAKETETSSSRWWDADTVSVAPQVVSLTKSIEQNQRGKVFRDAVHACLYGGQGFVAGLGFNPEILGMIPGGGMTNPLIYTGPSYNLIFSVVDTLSARITKNEPRANFLTDDGDWTLQQKAKKLNNFTDGLFYQTGFTQTAKLALTDALVFGTGIIKYSADADNNLQAERVFPSELWVDMWDGRTTKSPRSLFHRSLIDKDVLAAKYPKHRADILKAASVPNAGTFFLNALTNIVQVFEAWHLPSSADAGDGRHVVTLNGLGYALEDEEYESRDFPFTIIRYSPQMLGFWGRGIAELLSGSQRELNRVMLVEAQSHRLLSVPSIWLDVNSKININHAQDNSPGAIGLFQGREPVFASPQAVNPGFVSYKEWIISSAFQYVGVSQLSAASLKPAGVDSGIALENLSDIESDRFSALSHTWDNIFVDGARKLVNLARNVYTKTGAFKVAVIGKKTIQEIDWSEIDLDEDEYQLQVFPTSALPRTPTGRLDFIQKLMQANIISPQIGGSLLDFPDLEAEMSLYNAAYDDIQSCIDRMINHGEYQAADPLQDLQLGIQQVTAAYQKAKNMKGVSADNLDLLRRWLLSAQQLLKPPEPAAPPGPPPGATQPPGPPQAVPLPPPTSPLLSNLPAAA